MHFIEVLIAIYIEIFSLQVPRARIYSASGSLDQVLLVIICRAIDSD